MKSVQLKAKPKGRSIHRGLRSEGEGGEETFVPAMGVSNQISCCML